MSSASVSANNTPVVKARGGGLPSANGNRQTGSVQCFSCQLVTVEKSSLTEDENSSLPVNIVASENISPRTEIHSRMELNDSSKQAELLVTVVRCILHVVTVSLTLSAYASFVVRLFCLFCCYRKQ